MAAWLAAATGPRVDVAAPSPPVATAAREATQPSAAAAELAAGMERLRRKLAAAPSPRMGARNPFSLAPPPPSPDAADPTPGRAAPVVPRRPRATRPLVELIGIATANTENGSERTGILTTRGGEVILVRSGDDVAGGYRIETVESSSVTLVDGSGTRYRLALPQRPETPRRLGVSAQLPAP